MNWDALGAFGEIIGAFAVVVSLAYLATQIKTQNREARVASVHDISEAFRLGITSFQDAQRADVYINALNNFDLLSDSERLQFISMVQGLLRVWEEAFFQFAEDRLTTEYGILWLLNTAIGCRLVVFKGYGRYGSIRIIPISENLLMS